MDPISVLVGMVGGIVMCIGLYIVWVCPDGLEAEERKLDDEEAREAMTRLEEVFQRRER